MLFQVSSFIIRITMFSVLIINIILLNINKGLESRTEYISQPHTTQTQLAILSVSYQRPPSRSDILLRHY